MTHSPPAPADTNDETRGSDPSGASPGGSAGTGSPAEGEMGLFDHLAELRTRLIYSLIAVIICALLCLSFVQSLVDILIAPFQAAFPGKSLIGTSPEGAFLLKIKVAACAGLVLALPVVLFQVWRFLAPGLYDKEKRLALPFILVSSALFLLGVFFAYKLVLPFTMSFFNEQYESLAHPAPEGGAAPVAAFIEMSKYIDLLLQILLGFGVVFETPVLAYFLARLGILRTKLLIDGFRYAVVGIFVIAAVLTPPDVLTQFLMAGPLLLLYGISIVVVHFAQPAQKV